MSTTPVTDVRFAPADEVRAKSYLDDGHTVMSWLTTTDHKRIAILYALAITVFFFIGGAAIARCGCNCSSRTAVSSRRTSTIGCSRCTAS